MPAAAPPRFHLPRLMDEWKWPRHLNPHAVEISAESAAWTRSFGAFSPKAQKAFDRCNFSLLACLAYPLADKVHLRTACDLMNLFFVIDEHTDVADPLKTKEVADGCIAALRSPSHPLPEGSWSVFEMARQFGERVARYARPGPKARFLDAFAAYLDTVVLEAEDRAADLTRPMDEYVLIRRDNVGMRPSYALLEWEMDLPDEAIYHPVVRELMDLGIDMVMLNNDIVSYNMEQARGEHDYNCVESVMRNEGETIQGAIDLVASRHRACELRFMSLYLSSVPTFSSPQVNADLRRYLDGVANWVRANDAWGWESERYFGKKGLEVERERWVCLLPKESEEERMRDVGPRIIDESLL